MKTLRSRLQGGQFLILIFALLAGATKAFAQTTDSNLVPIVTVQATQPIATATNSGILTVFRAGNTNLALSVWYELSGTASNGVDYALVPPHLVQIAAGATSNSIIIKPLAQTSSSGTVKTVVLTLTNSPLMSPVNYEIGLPSCAVVYIKGSAVTNLPPFVEIGYPTNRETFFAPASINLNAVAADLDGSVTNVEFFAGTNDLGRAEMLIGAPPLPFPPSPNELFHLSWQNVPPGNYVLTAVATDNGGLSTTSAPVNITVLPPPTNLPPIVRIVSPANGTTFFAPVNIPLFAYARDFDGSVSSVEFFAGTNDLGFGQRLSMPVAANSPNPSPMPPIYPTNLFVLVWSNAPIGTFALTSKATDNDGAATISDPVKIAVLPSPPPPTNRPPIVSIVATDPVAVEGTNSWIWLGETNATPNWATWPSATCRWFTNRAPKTATFTVRRSGSTKADLTVTYDIGGTASNGVDYVALPGFVTVPAGQRRALITIVPIDDGPPDVNKTVILALTPSTNTPPDYLLGFPRRAGAIIFDGNGPRPVTGMLPGHYFHLKESGPNAAWFCIEYSTNLANWTPVCTNQVIDGSIDFVDPDTAGNSSKFYRAVPLTNPPSE